MQLFQIVTLVLTALFGTGGIVAWYKVHKTAQVGMSGVEVEDKAATTADWDALSKYWQGEMEAMRGEIAGLNTKVQLLETARMADAEHINILERWIYEGKPPPPPERRPYQP